MSPRCPTLHAMTSTELVFRRLLAVRGAAVAAAEAHRVELSELPADVQPGAENLLHYLAVRDVDLRDEQLALAELGLSSLGRAEAHVLATLDAVLARLAADLAGGRVDVPDGMLPGDLGALGPAASEGRSALERHAVDALGPAPQGHRTRVMVTLPTEAAFDPSLVEGLVTAGMSIARINSAHDGPDEWLAMVEHIRRAADRHGRSVRIAVDLAGPKLRTGPLSPEPAVAKVRPERDEVGRVVRPGRFVIRRPDGPPPAGDDVDVVVSGDLVDAAEVGDHITFDDARERARTVTVVDRDETSITVACDRTVYLVPGLVFVHRRSRKGRIRGVPVRPRAIELHAGDRLELRVGRRPGRPASTAGGQSEVPAMVSVDVPELFAALEPEARVLFDDGRIEALVEECAADRAMLRIVRPERAKLRAGKGINLPDVDLGIPALTDDDRRVLDVVTPFADLVAMSYVTRPHDVDMLHAELERRDAGEIGVILKIENRAAFEHLPELLFAALRRPPVVVMVARGDLAVEVGYQRLAEIQEEVLWLCEAAHVPVIWATQVLESLAKRGSPTRAEVTDAAWSGRAECVMLNKGPYIEETIAFLVDVLARMAGHQSKRMPMLRRLSVAAWGSASDGESSS